MSKRVGSALESLVTAAILLVLVQSFFEDFSLLGGWGMELRRPILLAGFLFDLFFTVEFLARLFGALMQGRAVRYLTRERGWIDFLASVPLLMFASGPTAAALLFPGTLLIGAGRTFNALKLVKVVRIARALRFLRVLKVLRRVRYVDSAMAQRHVSRVITIATTVAVFSLFLFTLATSGADTGGPEQVFRQHQARVAARLVEAAADPAAMGRVLNTLRDTEETLLVVRLGGRPLFARYEDGYFRRYFGPGEYGYLQRGELEIFFDERPLARGTAREGLLFYALVLLLVLAFLLAYGPHFTWTVSDPIHVIRRGMRDRVYNRKVVIPERYREDEVYRLARVYNERYLPAKKRNPDPDGGSLLDLDDDDIKSLLER